MCAEELVDLHRRGVWNFWALDIQCQRPHSIGWQWFSSTPRTIDARFPSHPPSSHAKMANESGDALIGGARGLGTNQFPVFGVSSLIRRLFRFRTTFVFYRRCLLCWVRLFLRFWVQTKYTQKIQRKLSPEGQYLSLDFSRMKVKQYEIAIFDITIGPKLLKAE